MEVSLNYCSQNGGNVYRAPYYTGNPNIGPRIIGNLDQSPYTKPKGPRTQQIIGSVQRGYRGMYRDLWGLYKGPRTQIMGLWGPNTVHSIVIVFGP